MNFIEILKRTNWLDFFGNGDLSALEESLVGSRLGEDLKQRLLQLDLGNYINGTTADDLYRLIMNI